MYIVEIMTITNPHMTVAVSSPKELYELVSILDETKYVVVWRIQEYTPKHFGWSMSWKKYADKFTTEHFEFCKG